VDRQHLLAEMTQARQCKYVMADEEYLPGLISIGAPLCDSLSGKGIGAVSFDFSVLQHDTEAIKDNYRDLIIQTAASLSALLPPGKIETE
jgi:DNA-binding IclR family transcriptional regulator